MSKTQSSNSTELRVLRALCEDCMSSYAIRVLHHIYYEDWLGLINLDFDTDLYISPAVFNQDYLIYSYLRKWTGFKDLIDINTRQVAVDNWKVVEQAVLETNRNLQYHMSHPSDSDDRLSAILYSAQRKISEILGPFSLKNLLADTSWTNGATVDLKHGTTIDKKISLAMSVTESCLPYARLLLEHDPAWFQAVTGHYPEGAYCLTNNNFKLVRGNKFLTVPKTAKTDRAISKEPTLNLHLQLGVKNWLQPVLNRHGIRLSDQERNQRYAKFAYTRGLATVDLQNASDSLAIALVRILLPIDWFNYLDAIRSRSVYIDGSWVKTSKFCSMGNAFAFPLESLIFFALSQAVMEECHCTRTLNRAIVYGDDIIVPKACFLRLTEVFQQCGFSINMDKSYWSGYFYESCGKHYFRGFDVTPVYQKNCISSGLHERIRAHNRLYRWRARNDDQYLIAGSLKDVFRLLLSRKEKRDVHIPRIPGLGSDDGFIVDVRHLSSFDSNHGYYCRVLLYKATNGESRNEAAHFAYKIRRPSVRNSSDKGHVEVHTGRGKWIYKKRYIQAWPNQPVRD